MKEYMVSFSENGDEYTGFLYVTCRSIKRDPNNECVFYADGVRIEIDERIYEIEEVQE